MKNRLFLFLFALQIMLSIQSSVFAYPIVNLEVKTWSN